MTKYWDLGGAEVGGDQAHLVEMVRRDVYFLDEIDRRIFKAIYKLSAKERRLKLKARSRPESDRPALRLPPDRSQNLARNLLALGLEKAPPKQKTFEEILSEPEESDETMT